MTVTSEAVVVFCVGVIVQTAAQGPQSIYGGRFITGLGIGSLSAVVPLYNAEVQSQFMPTSALSILE